MLIEEGNNGRGQETNKEFHTLGTGDVMKYFTFPIFRIFVLPNCQGLGPLLDVDQGKGRPLALHSFIQVGGPCGASSVLLLWTSVLLLYS